MRSCELYVAKGYFFLLSGEKPEYPSTERPVLPQGRSFFNSPLNRRTSLVYNVFMIRKSISFPSELHKIITDLAKQSHRSFTQQVIWMLSQAVERKLVVIVKESKNVQQDE
jgi:hypothetical protein